MRRTARAAGALVAAALVLGAGAPAPSQAAAQQLAVTVPLPSPGHLSVEAIELGFGRASRVPRSLRLFAPGAARLPASVRILSLAARSGSRYGVYLLVLNRAQATRRGAPSVGYAPARSLILRPGRWSAAAGLALHFAAMRRAVPLSRASSPLPVRLSCSGCGGLIKVVSLADADRVGGAQLAAAGSSLGAVAGAASGSLALTTYDNGHAFDWSPGGQREAQLGSLALLRSAHPQGARLVPLVEAAIHTDLDADGVVGELPALPAFVPSLAAAPIELAAHAPPASPPAPVPPTATVPPTITGSWFDGQIVVAHDGVWNGTGPLTYSYRWSRCSPACSPIPGAMGHTYTISPSDVGSSLDLLVTASGAGGSGSAHAEPTPAIAAAAPHADAPPSIAGTAADGQTLTATSGSWSGTPTLSYAFAWQRCDATGSSCKPITAGTGVTYAVGPGDVGATLRVVVTATNAAGSVSTSSSPTALVGAAAPVNRALPQIAGRAVDGQTLLASAGVWSGTPPIAFAYAWQRCDAAGSHCAAIQGASQPAYLAEAADVGSALVVNVTATNSAGTSGAASQASSAVAAAAPLAGSAPALSGEAVDGQTLTATTGSWSGTGPLSYSYAWESCDPRGAACAPIAGASTALLRLDHPQVGASVRAVVTATGPGGASDAPSAASAPIAPAAPASIAPPEVTGTAEDGQSLSASAGAWTGTPPLTLSYRWQRCDGGACADLAGATAASYTAAHLDVGHTLRVAIDAANQAGTSSAASGVTATVAAAPLAAAAAPRISGQTVDGQTLTADTGGWSGTPPSSYGYTWLRCAQTCSSIAGAAGPSYMLAHDDVGKAIEVTVRATNDAGAADSTSAPTGPVAAAPPISSSPPVISGSAVDGGQLSATSGGWSGTPPLAFGYQWQACDLAGAVCAPIAGATAPTYALTPTDVGTSVGVVVTATNAAGSQSASVAGVTVAPTPPVSVQVPALTGTAASGVTLTSSSGGWSGTPPFSLSYAWQRCDKFGSQCSPIDGARGASYTAADADAGGALRATVTATNGAGSATAWSPPSAQVTPAPPALVSPPSLAGQALAGQTLSTSTGSWTGVAPITYGYQWLRCDTSGAGCTNVGGATGPSYTLVDADVGHTLAVVVTATNGGGPTLALSAPSALVTSPATPPPAATTLDTSKMLRGVNAPGLYTSTNYWTHLSGEPASTYTYLASRGVKLIRLPLAWGNLQPALGGQLDPDYVAAVRAEVSNIEAAGMGVVLDLHGYCRWPDPSSTITCGNGISKAQLADVWIRLSDLFRADPGVIAYDIQNEPHNLPTGTWTAYSQGVVDALRANEDGKLLWIENIDWASAGTWAMHQNGPWINDPSGNFMYSAHEYLNGTGDYTAGKDYGLYTSLENSALTRLASFTDWLAKYHVRGSIGEIGWPSSLDTPTWPQWNALGEQWYNAADSAGLWVTYFSAMSSYHGVNTAYDAPQNTYPFPGVSQAQTQAQVIEAHPSGK